MPAASVEPHGRLEHAHVAPAAPSLRHGTAFDVDACRSVPSCTLTSIAKTTSHAGCLRGERGLLAAVTVGMALARSSDCALNGSGKVLAGSGTLVECGAASTFRLAIRRKGVASRMTVQSCTSALSGSTALRWRARRGARVHGTDPQCLRGTPRPSYPVGRIRVGVAPKSGALAAASAPPAQRRARNRCPGVSRTRRTSHF